MGGGVIEAKILVKGKYSVGTECSLGWQGSQPLKNSFPTKLFLLTNRFIWADELIII